MNFTSYLHSLHTLQEGKKKKLTRDLKKKKTFLEKLFLLFFFVIESLHSCQRICTWLFVATKKKERVLFQWVGQMNNSVNHIKGIKLFSCTEPPSRKVTDKRWSDWDEFRASYEIIIFQWHHWKMYIAHTQSEWFTSRWLDVVTFCLNARWNVFMEIILMMCLGKSYFL